MDPSLDKLFRLLFVVPAILISLTVHEFSHGYMAYVLGDSTAKQQRRLTLNPLRHLDPLGTLLLVISSLGGAGFGWAKPVPFNPAYFKNIKRDTALVGVAGPMSNLLLGFVSMLAMWIMYPNFLEIMVFSGAFLPFNSAQHILVNFLRVLTTINIYLAIFNLIPIPPLDGSKIFAMFLSPKAHYYLLQYERYGMIILMLLIFLGALNKILSIFYWFICMGFVYILSALSFFIR